MAEATSEKLVGTIGIRVSETTDRELDTLIEKLEDVNSVADPLVKKTLTLDIKTDTIESKISSVSKGLNKELREQLVGGFRVALDEMKASLKEADVSFKVSFDVAEFSAQLTQAVTAAASTFSTSIANDLQAAVAQFRQSGAASITVTPQTGSTNNAGQTGGGRAGGAGNRELARIYSQITASIREEYRLMTQMLRLEGDAYQSASERLQVVRDQVDAYREMIQQAAEAGQADPVRAANLDSLQASLASKLDIATYQVEQRNMQQEAAELLRLYTQLLDVTQRIRLAGDDATAGMVLQRQQIREAYLAQKQVVESYRDTADGAAIWADYLQRIEELTGRYAENTETKELVREQEKLNALRLEEVQLAYQTKGGVSEELELVSRKAATQQAVVDQMAAQYGRSEAFLAAQRNGVAQVTRELEKQAQVTAQMQDAESRKSEQALYSFNVSELQQAYKDIISSTTQLWTVQEKIKTATSAELPYLQQIETALQNRLTLSQNVFSRLKDYPEAIQLQGKLTDELAVKQAEYNLQLLKSQSHADSLAHTLEHMAGNLLSDVVRGFAREVANAFREAAVYVEEFNSLLTEISIVTGRTQSEVEELGSSYRALAKDMKVTSTQIAEAAVGYYRQGLNDNQVMERLGKTIQFSKTSGLEFADAAEYLTATVNSMDVTIERAADTEERDGIASSFAYLVEGIAALEETQGSVDGVRSAQDQLTVEFESVMGDLIKDRIYDGRDYSSDQEEVLYQDVVDALAKRCYPEVEYDCDVVVLSEAVGYEIESVHIGDRVRLVDNELGIDETSYITDFVFRPGSHEPPKVAIGNYLKHYTDFYSRMILTTQQYQDGKRIYDRAAIIQPDGTIDSTALEESLRSANLNAGIEDSVHVGDDGVVVTNPLDPGGSQLKMVDGALYSSNDGGLTWTLVLDGNGISPDMLAQGVLDSGKLTIMDGESQAFVWNSTGLYALHPQYPDTHWIRYSKDGIAFTQDNGKTYVFQICWDGVLFRRNGTYMSMDAIVNEIHTSVSNSISTAMQQLTPEKIVSTVRTSKEYQADLSDKATNENVDAAKSELTSQMQQTAENVTATFNRIGLAGAQTGIVKADIDGVTVSMQDGDEITGSSRLGAEGLTIYDANGDARADFGSGDKAWIKKLIREDIDCPSVVKSYIGSGTLNLFVAATATGDGSGRDSSNKSNGVNNALRSVLGDAKHVPYGMDIQIHVEAGSYNEQKVPARSLV